MDDGFLGVVYSGAHRFGSLTYLKSVVFQEIPLYHSVVSSEYYHTCKVINYFISNPIIDSDRISSVLAITGSFLLSV